MHDELLSDASTVIPLVHHRMGERRLCRHLGKDGRKDGTFMTVLRRQDDRNAGAFIATAGMDFRGQTTPRATQSLCGLAAVFFKAPAACWCARTLVASINKWCVRKQPSCWNRSQS